MIWSTRDTLFLYNEITFHTCVRPWGLVNQQPSGVWVNHQPRGVWVNHRPRGVWVNQQPRGVWGV